MAPVVLSTLIARAQRFVLLARIITPGRSTSLLYKARISSNRDADRGVVTDCSYRDGRPGDHVLRIDAGSTPPEPTPARADARSTPDRRC